MVLMLIIIARPPGYKDDIGESFASFKTKMY